MWKGWLRCSAYRVVVCAVYLFLTSVSTGVCQSEGNRSSAIPYRRVFVPTNDLGSIGLDGFSPIDVKLLDELIQQYSKPLLSTSSGQYASDTFGKVQLQSAYYVAKLAGTDLLSERSQLTLAGSPRIGERVSLRPWSLAVESVKALGLRAESQTAPDWIFDEQGAPLVSAVNQDLVGRLEGSKQGEFVLSFGWSAKSDSASTQKKLKFSFEVPRCSNSCLVLALPAQAIVQECATVARRVDQLTEIDLRLKGWSDFYKENMWAKELSHSQESLWLVELGGSQLVSFSIVNGLADRPQDDANNAETNWYSQLLRSQKLEHIFEGQEIRTICEADVIVSTEQQSLGISLMPGSRLRRLTLNQRDVEWQINNGWIQFNAESVFQGTTPSSSVSVLAEFISPLSQENLENLETPRILFDRGYVMSGSTVVQTIAPWHLTNVDCEAGKIVDSTEDAKSAGVRRLEYSWYASPPRLTVGLEQIKQTRRCELLTRLVNDDDGISAVVRAKLYFAEQDSGQSILSISEGWSVQSIKSLDQSDAVAYQLDTDALSTAREIKLNWDRVQKNRVSDIEIRLHRSIKGRPRRLEQESVFQMRGWDRSDTLVVEDNGLFQLKLRDELLDILVADDQIPEWQRLLLPKLSTAYVFRFGSKSTELDANNDINAEMVAKSAIIPDLDWYEKPSRHQAAVKTLIDRISEVTLRAQHEIAISLSPNRKEPLSIELPSEHVVWRLQRGSKWVPLLPLEAGSDLKGQQFGKWQFDVLQLESKCTLMAVVTEDTSTDDEVIFPVPYLLNADIQNREARCIASDISIHSRDEPSHWSIDEKGFKFLKSGAIAMDSALVAKVADKLASKNWFAMESELHVAIDMFGSQMGSLLFRASSSPQQPLAIELEDGWEPLTVRLSRSSIVRDVPFRIDGRRLIMSFEEGVLQTRDRSANGKLDIHGPTDLYVDLKGPRLSRKSSLGTLSESYWFNWPEFPTEATNPVQRRFLWLSEEMQLDKSTASFGSTKHSIWQLWNWSPHVVALIFGDAHSEDASVMNEHTMASCELVPSWAAEGWRIMDSTSNLSDAKTIARAGEFVKVRRVDSDRSYLALLFAFAAMITPRLILFRSHVATSVAVFLIAGAHFASYGASRFAYTALVGMCVGYIAFVLYRLLASRATGDGSVSRRYSTRISPWNNRSGENESESNYAKRNTGSAPSIAGNIGALGICLTVGWGIASHTSPLLTRAAGQEATGGNSSTVYQIAIPMDDSGSMAGTMVYVPTEMLDVLTGKPERSRNAERGSHPFAAKYSLRLGTRGRVFNSADQITMAYDFLVGDDLSPVRFPLNAEKLQLTRFSVDGNELNVGSKLRSTGSEWIWTPEKSGKRSVQIIAQPVLKSNETDRNREAVIQQLDIAVLPIANASIEIDTDPQNSIDVVSRGRVTNPTAGRLVAMLGAVDRLQCSVIAPLAKLSGDTPIMNTELFLQNDILQAKTIIDFPKGLSTTKEIEIEADIQWLPVGTQWGDAQWVESRPGSTLSKRRYVLEWKQYPNSATAASSSARDRRISVIWIPQTASQSLNVLFAECRDRRTRLGTLRYARAAGANWSIEGINTWVPAIGSRERLDWSELKANPVATSLRIPPNGGLGILKPKSTPDKQQGRVTTKWIVDESRESLTSRIELLGGTSVSDTLVVDLQNDFLVTDVYNRSGPIRFLQSKSNGKRRLQILAEKKSLEISDIWIQAKRQESGLSVRFSPATWLELPWIALPNSVNSDQTLEIVASERIGFRLESEPALLFGQGLSESMINLAKSFLDIQSQTSASSRYQIIQRNKPLLGKLSISLNSNLSPREIEVSGTFSRTAYSRPFFVLQVPASLKDRWQGERINVIQGPDPSLAWLQVYLSDPTTSENETQVTSNVRFVPRSDDASSDLELMSQIRALDQESISTYKSDSALDVTGGEVLDGTAVAAQAHESSKKLAIAKCIFQIRDIRFLENLKSRRLILESQYWIEDREDAGANRKLEWQLGDEVEVVSLVINGTPVDFEKDGRRIRCSLVQAGLCAEVVVFSQHILDERNDSELRIDAPFLIGLPPNANTVLIEDSRVGVKANGQLVTAMTSEQSIKTIAKSGLDILEKSIENSAFPGRIQIGSDWDRWQKYWNQKVYRYLQAWSKSNSADEQEAYGLAVQRWHSLQTQLPVKDNVAVTDRPSKGIKGFVHGGIDTPEPRLNRAEDEAAPFSKWYSLCGCLLILFSLTWTASFGQIILNRPWWCLLALGFFAWLVSGSSLPALVLGTFGLIVAMDSYWIVISRLRRTGIRGQRSL